MQRVLAISGSLRTGSYNTSLLKVAVALLQDQGAEVEVWDFRAFPLPIYDADMEKNEGLPDNVVRLKDAITSADAVVIAGPEYNAGPTPLLKNAIDWTSRKTNVWENKVVLLTSASTGQLGGSRAHYAYRNSLAHLRAFILPELIMLPRAEEAFDEQGNLLNERTKEALERSTKRLLEIAARLKGI